MQMKGRGKIIAWLLSIMLITAALPAVALASGGAPALVDASRITLTIPGGLDCIPTITDGAVNLSVTETDWQGLAGESWYGYFMWYVNVAAPSAEYVKMSAIAGDIAPLLSNMDFYLEDEGPYERTTASKDIVLAEIKQTASGEVCVPQDMTDLTVIIRWYNEDETQTYTEMLTVNSTHASNRAYNITMQYPAASRVTFNPEGLNGISGEYDTARGLMYYKAEDKDALEAYIANGTTMVSLVLEGPANAAKYALDYPDDKHNTTDGTIHFGLGFENGGAIATSYGTSLNYQKIFWYDSSDTLLLAETFGKVYYDATNGTWGDTATTMTAVPAGRIVQDEAFTGSGVTPVITDGNIHITFTQSGEVDIAGVGAAGFNIIAPADAVSYKLAWGGGGMYDAIGRDWMENSLNSLAEEEQLNGADGVRYDFKIFDRATLADESMDIFYSRVLPYSYSSAIAVEWFNASGASMGVEFVMCIIDNYSHIDTTPAINSTDGIVDPFAAPTIVSAEDWQLCAEHVAVSGEDAVFYELSLKDTRTNGYLSNLEGEGNKVILPFPEGMTYEQALEHDFRIKHYNYDLTEYVEETATITPLGIAFNATSFSPYLMGWALTPIPPQPPENPQVNNTTTGGIFGSTQTDTAAQQAITPPQTGAASYIGVAMLALLAAGVCLAAARKRGRR